MLPESHLAGINSNLLKKQVDTGEEVTQSLIINNAVADGLANSQLLHGSLSRQLSMAVKEI